MNGKEIFAAAVRIVGLISVGRGISDLGFVFMYYLGASDLSVTVKVPNADLIYGIFYFLIGLYLLRGAPLLISFAYPDKLETSKNIENNTEKSQTD